MIGADVFGRNELIVFSLEQTDSVSEICHFVLVWIVEHIVILYQIFRND